MKTTTTSTTAQELSRALLTLGFEQGKVPRHIPERHLRIDRACAGTMKCGSCGKRGMTYIPFRRCHEYRAVAACRHCGAAEEM
jgi:hypothetical protein